MNPIMQYFEYDHLTEGSEHRRVSAQFYELAHAMDERVPNSAEKSAGLRKLLEAKDCMVRATLS